MLFQWHSRTSTFVSKATVQRMVSWKDVERASPGTSHGQAICGEFRSFVAPSIERQTDAPRGPPRLPLAKAGWRHASCPCGRKLPAVVRRLPATLDQVLSPHVNCMIRRYARAPAIRKSREFLAASHGRRSLSNTCVVWSGEGTIEQCADENHPTHEKLKRARRCEERGGRQTVQVSPLTVTRYTVYRVTKQVSDLGWVDLHLAGSPSCLGSA